MLAVYMGVMDVGEGIIRGRWARRCHNEVVLSTDVYGRGEMRRGCEGGRDWW